MSAVRTDGISRDGVRASWASLYRRAQRRGAGQTFLRALAAQAVEAIAASERAPRSYALAAPDRCAVVSDALHAADCLRENHRLDTKLSKPGTRTPVDRVIDEYRPKWGTHAPLPGASKAAVETARQSWNDAQKRYMRKLLDVCLTEGALRPLRGYRVPGRVVVRAYAVHARMDEGREWLLGVTLSVKPDSAWYSVALSTQTLGSNEAEIEDDRAYPEYDAKLDTWRQMDDGSYLRPKVRTHPPLTIALSEYAPERTADHVAAARAQAADRATWHNRTLDAWLPDSEDWWAALTTAPPARPSFPSYRPAAERRRQQLPRMRDGVPHSPRPLPSVTPLKTGPTPEFVKAVRRAKFKREVDARTPSLTWGVVKLPS